MSIPDALTVSEIKQLTQDFADATKRSVDVGFDVIEIHSAHGYLLHEFLSPQNNLRTDEYGGSFENCTRFFT
jgi:NADPH2 dehydrogenase